MHNKKIYYIDTTLRDGEQAPGVSFSIPEKITIAHMLDVCGIDELEAGIPAMGDKERQVIKVIADQGFSFRISTWSRAIKKDIDTAKCCGADGINISFPVSDIQLEAINKNRKWVLNSLKEMVGYARNYFAYVSIGAQDASRAERNFLETFIILCQECGVDRIRIADTVGCHDPFSCYDLISRTTNRYPNVRFEYHAHNDLGMATANTLAAIAAGVSAVSTTINGLGERAGNASMDEVVIAVRKTLGRTDKINSRFFPYLAGYVEKISGRRLSDSKPITGKTILQHESGIHTRSILINKESYQFIDGPEIGRHDYEIVFGKHSGTFAVLRFFEDKGIRLEKKTLKEIMQQIKLLSTLRKKAIAEEELLDLYYRMT